MSLTKYDKEFLWHPYTQMQDWISWDSKLIVGGSGFNVIDQHGSPLLDGVANMWCNVWGHQQNSISEAMIDQIRKIPHSTLFGLASESSAALSRRLVGYAKGMAKVFFTDNGSSAVEASLKMGLQYWKNKGRHRKTKFISLKRGYHGDTAGAMSVGYIEGFFTPYKPMLFPAMQLPTPFDYKERNQVSTDSIAECIKFIEAVLKEHSATCAGIIMESGAQIAGGVIIYPPGFQKAISELCNKYDLLLIIDEIATGFGRLGNFVEYIAQHCNPDIVCFGKALTGGYFPLAVTLATDEVYQAFNGRYSERKHLFHGHTFTGHSVGCATALANLNLYEDKNLIQHIRKASEHLRLRLNEFKKYPVVSDIRHAGLLAGIELAKGGKALKKLSNGQPINYFVMKEAQRRGVYTRPLGNIMMIVPPLAIGLSDLDRLVDVKLELTKQIQDLC